MSRRGPSGTSVLRLLDFVRKIVTAQGPREILTLAVDAALDITGAERGFVVVPDGLGRYESTLARDVGRVPTPRGEINFSSTLVTRSLKVAPARVLFMPHLDEEFRDAASLHGLHIQSAIVCALVVHGRTLGAVVLHESERLDGPFDRVDLQLVEQVLTHASERLAGALEGKALELRLEEHRRQAEAPNPAPEFVGSSPFVARLVHRIALVAGSRANVIIHGPTGTGKELVARALHRLSPRAAGPWYAVSCAGVKDELLGSELFGHVVGAFTGAAKARKGAFQSANGGTLFLDEVGEMSRDLQAMLLRVIEDRTLRPVGEDTEVKLDVRIVVASHEDLEAKVEKKEFRADLFHRLNGMKISTLPLDDHPEDIPELAQHFADLHAKDEGWPRTRLSPTVLRALQQHEWDGNQRELRNAVQRGLLNARGGEVLVPHLELAPLRGRPVKVSTETIRAVYQKHLRRVAPTAKELGISRRTVQRRVKDADEPPSPARRPFDPARDVTCD